MHLLASINAQLLIHLNPTGCIPAKVCSVAFRSASFDKTDALNEGRISKQWYRLDRKAQSYWVTNRPGQTTIQAIFGPLHRLRFLHSGRTGYIYQTILMNGKDFKVADRIIPVYSKENTFLHPVDTRFF